MIGIIGIFLPPRGPIAKDPDSTKGVVASGQLNLFGISPDGIQITVLSVSVTVQKRDASPSCFGKGLSEGD
jgi:hypothetical protein